MAYQDFGNCSVSLKFGDDVFASGYQPVCSSNCNAAVWGAESRAMKDSPVTGPKDIEFWGDGGSILKDLHIYAPIENNS